ncbi:splicing factor 3B subunit 3 [Rhizoctonia solani AG-1 IA]|uniref:Pre-mRNA-splicing factor RSE1 n=1 Tax=Thanatephorus cucumeris (strain AG1-IA) TaxID=983506 RepID=L8WW97_THACA|nr:splicing factor 3B subunit 3 [Rhizoctonia solani AG-1 IA]
MHLYNLTLQAPTAITQAIVGNFSGIRQQEIIISRGTILELLRPDSSTGKVSTVLAQDVFGTIRSIAAFRLTGGTKDYCIVGSDSGRIIVLEYDPKTNSFTKLQQETFGKSGSRRIVPGEMLAVDPKGRSVMISAVEKSKLVYVLNRDAAANLTISSPLEAHRNGAIIHAIVGVDVGFENPLFAALEVDYTESDADPTGQAFRNAEKMLTFYELDLGLNHVVRKSSEPTDRRANLLVQVPGGQSATTNAFDGPSGVLVCCEDHIIYRPVDLDGGAVSHRVPIPRRRTPWGGDEERGLIITSAVMHKMKVCDLYKVTLEHEDEIVKSMTIKYFDTVPTATSLCILKSGFLFVAAEGGNHHLYQFQKLGDDDAEPEFTSNSYSNNGISSSPLPPCYFRPHPLDNLVLADEMTSFCPILDARILNLFGPTSGGMSAFTQRSDEPSLIVSYRIVPATLQSDTPQFYLACGRGARSSFRMLRHGLEVEESVSSELPGVPNGVWTVKVNDGDQYDKYIILSFVNGTLVLSIGETIEEVADTGFLSSAPTLAVQQLADNGGLIQVHPGGVRHVRPSQGDLASTAGVTEWRAPQGRQVASATTNTRQVCVALNSGELVYFELDLNGVLQEYGEMRAVGSAVVCMSIAEVPEGRQPNGSNHFLGPRVDLGNHLVTGLSRHVWMLVVGLTNETSVVGAHGTSNVYFFLGTRPVRLTRVSVQRNTCILALSSRSWLNYTHQNLLRFSPLIYENLDHAWSFSAELCPEGLIGIAGSVLRIFQIPKLSDKLKQVTMPLSYTPRKIAVHPEHQLFYVIESDHRTWGSEAKNKRLAELVRAGRQIDQELVDLPAEDFGLPRAGAGQWASCIRIIDPTEVFCSATLFKIELDNNESAFSVAVVPFAARENELFLVVGTAKDTNVLPRQCVGAVTSGSLVKLGWSTHILTRPIQTEVDDVPLALLGIKGRLCAGVGKALRIYEMGKKKLLRKSENKGFATAIVTLTSQGSRIIVGEMQESVHYATYKPESNRLLVFADDTSARWVTSAALVDYDTVAVGDKFGNIFVNRLPANISQQVDDDPTGAGIMHEREFLHGAPHKTKLLAHYNVGDIVTSVHRAALVPGGRDVVAYTGLHGTIGVLIPLASKEDVDFITTLEQHMRSEHSSLVGRDHLAYRGYYVPVKAVVDGDLCERFAMLPSTKQKSIAGELDRTVGEVLKKLEGLRVAGSGF